MDLQILVTDELTGLMAERQQIADEFRAKITSLGMLRGRLMEAPTERVREHWLAAIDDEAARFHDLGDKLLQLQASVLALQDRTARGL